MILDDADYPISSDRLDRLERRIKELEQRTQPSITIYHQILPPRTTSVPLEVGSVYINPNVLLPSNVTIKSSGETT